MKEAHNDLVMVLRKKGDNKAALKVCEHALKKHKNDDTLHRNKGNILYAMDEPEKALEAFEAALDLNAHVVDTWVNKGTVLYIHSWYEYLGHPRFRGGFYFCSHATYR